MMVVLGPRKIVGISRRQCAAAWPERQRPCRCLPRLLVIEARLQRRNRKQRMVRTLTPWWRWRHALDELSEADAIVHEVDCRRHRCNGCRRHEQCKPDAHFDFDEAPDPLYR